MSYQGKKSIPHITVSGPGKRCPRSFVRGAGKGERRERSARGRGSPQAAGPELPGAAGCRRRRPSSYRWSCGRGLI